VVTLAAIAVAVAVIVVLIAIHPPAQITLRLRHVAPLTMAACISEATHFGYSVDGARNICSFGKSRSWYHAVLTNKGQGAYPSCRATGFDRSGKAVFGGSLPFALGGFPAGLFARGHRSIAFYWYLPSNSTFAFLGMALVDARAGCGRPGFRPRVICGAAGHAE